MRVLIAGCGYVGSRLADRLKKAGDDVFCLSRTGKHATGTPVVADVTKLETLSVLPPDLDKIVYCVSAGQPSDGAYRAAYVDGVRNVIQALRSQRQQVRRVIFVSSTGVYPQSAGEDVDENSSAEPSDFSGIRLREGEKLALQSGFQAVTVRFAGIYGPGRTRLLDIVRNKTPQSVQALGAYTNRIHAVDCARMLEHVLKLPSPASIYIGADNEPVKLKDVLEWIARRLGVEMPPVIEDTKEKLRGSSKRCSNRRIRGSGFNFQFPTFREGYEDVLEQRGRSLRG